MTDAASPMVVAGTTIEPGTRTVVRIPVTTDLDGGDVAIYVHVLHGAQPGPVLGLFTAQHGNEWIGIEMIRTLLDDLDTSAMAGTLVAVPVCNPLGLGTVQRNIQPESDGPDMNRIWPGTHTWLPESITRVIAAEVVPHCTALLDYHPGPWGVAFAAVVYGSDYADAEVNARSEALALAYGYDSVGPTPVMGVFPGPRSLTGYAGSALGIPSAAVEVGGTGFSLDEEAAWLAANHRGITNVMRHLGILDGELALPDRRLRYRRLQRVNPSIGGLLMPTHQPETLLRPVQHGEVLGRIVSPYTLDELEQLVAPFDGYLMYAARSYCVRPGDWGFGVIDGAGAYWE